MGKEHKMEMERSNQLTLKGNVRQPAQIQHSLGYAIRRAQMRVYEKFFSTLAEFNTTPTHYTLMLLIRENMGIRAVDLSRNLSVAPSRMAKLIDDLEHRKLLSRETLRSDRRNRILVLTTEGEQKLQQLEQLVERHEAQLIEGLSQKERDCLLGLLQRVAQPR